MTDPYRRASKLMSLLLRHQPELGGLTLDPAGWTDVDALLGALAAKGQRLTRNELEDLVADNAKRRFAFDDEGARIRAVQGHSVSVDLGYESVTPPDVLYHGTVARFIASIRVEGLRSGARNHVHLSVDVPTATIVGQRRGKPVILTIDSAAMHADGHLFYVADNGVWLTASVPVVYIAGWGDGAS